MYWHVYDEDTDEVIVTFTDFKKAEDRARQESEDTGHLVVVSSSPGTTADIRVGGRWYHPGDIIDTVEIGE